LLNQVYQVGTLECWHLFKSIAKDTDCENMECVLESATLTKRGQLSIEELLEIKKEADFLNVAAVLAWDCLPTEFEFQEQLKLFNSYHPETFSAVRVQDYGVLSYVSQKYSTQLILETGHHNLKAIQALVSAFPENLSRLILSNEVPKETIKIWSEHLSMDLELLVLGSLQIFYSPRRLLSVQTQQLGEHRKTGISKEDGRLFSFVENQHGTTMYLDKILFLCEYIAEIQDAGVTFGRYNLHSINGLCNQELLINALRRASDLLAQKELRASFHTSLTRGFFRANKTDRQFKNLKNSVIRQHQPNALARVLESAKKKFLVLETLVSLESQKTYLFLTPDSRRIEKKIEWFQKPLGEKCCQTNARGIWICSTIPGVSAGTVVLECEK